MRKSFKVGTSITVITMVLGGMIYSYNSQYKFGAIALVNTLEIGSLAFLLIAMWSYILLTSSKGNDKFNRGILGDYIDMLNENIISEEEFIRFCNEIRYTTLEVKDNTKAIN